MAVESTPSSVKDKDKMDVINVDVERHAVAEAHLKNTTIRHLAWKGVTVTVKDRETKLPKEILENVEGIVEAGEICALMGPSGCGKTTLLNVLASRPTGAQSVEGEVLVNGSKPSRSAFREMSRFVEQEDALIGSLTVRETLNFASRLASTSSLPTKERVTRIDGLLDSFGLREQASTLIGTPVRKGISGGQKRRVGVASQLITSPKILFLDEPTSGLDSAASFEVVNYLKGVAKRNNLIVVVSIHQPSTAVFNLFDKLLLLSAGKTHFFGRVSDVERHYESIGHELPLHVNPAEFLLELVNIDFSQNRNSASDQLDELHKAWTASPRAGDLTAAVEEVARNGDRTVTMERAEKKPSMPSVILTLLHRSFIKSYRDVFVYGIRFAMYIGLAIMMGTVWLRLEATQESIIPLINGIFFGSAFMSFMAVAYCPAYLEDYLQFVKEKHNGLYGPTELVISNFLIGLPYLFLISLIFSAISYWLSNFQPTALAFFTWVFWLFLDLLAAEGLVVFMTSLFPSFVISLALVAFANGLWMSVDGFMVQPGILNVFYKYVFHYWDYQKYVFENMMINEFSERTYTCTSVGDGCQCMWQTELADQCLIAGQGVLDQYGYAPGHMRKDIGIMMGIIVGYRVAGWIVLKLKK
ncbi:P-loop containing nucleoside triphosphate hydrolase protein [Podospora aff. communis PSN243]|uniref:P-loop containing nucleoside triphosphate hydrolase protein n=1 Tax=Podospora aff. communis PSN243 TaxID=3040156 RepID=A0AAV9GA00_9PEZI|nr:P-loop containing nucleoside triphosphate hydrolase protein [Podospora aff. communis PSN243]